VVAIRGTSSLADLVTDAVVHPEAIDDWLPPAQAKARPRAVLCSPRALPWRSVLAWERAMHACSLLLCIPPARPAQA
jgi:hypothetical protein